MPGSFASRLMRNPRYQQAIQKRMSVGPEVAAVPNTSDITQAYGSDMARTELSSKRHASAMDIGQKRLDLRGEGLDLGRERLSLDKELHSSGMELTHAKQDVARSQGRLAVGIGVANIGLQGMAGLLEIQDANKITAAIGEQRGLIDEAAKLDKTEADRARTMKNRLNLRFVELLKGGVS